MIGRSVRGLALVAFCGGYCLTVTVEAHDQQSQAEAPTRADRAALEQQFAQRMSGATLIGSFTVAGRENGQPGEERYEIANATPLQNDYWRFTARIRYGQTDVQVPIVLKVLWAGDTPVITLTDLRIPPLGTFTARVMIYGDRYAGTWQHGAVGGHLWGRIEQTAERQPVPAPRPD